MSSRRLRLVAPAFAFAIVVGACGTGTTQTSPPASVPSGTAGAASGSASPSSSANLTTVRYGLPTATYYITTVGIHYAYDNGYFAQQGINLEITPYNGDPTVARALLSNQADIVDTSGDGAFLLYASGGPIKIIYSPIATSTGSTVAGPSIHSITDLAGKKIAIGAPGDQTFETISIELRQKGVDTNSIDWVTVAGGPTPRITAVLAGQVDATGATILILKPVLDAIAAGQMNVIAQDKDYVPDVPTSYDITTAQYAKDHADIVQKFVTAEMMGFRWAQTHPEDAAKIAEKYIKNTPLDLLTKGMHGMSQLGAYGLDGGFSLDTIASAQTQLIELGELTEKQKADPTEIADPSFIQKAAQQLGPAPTLEPTTAP